ncbi:MAG: Ku protein [Candidatus Andersenbacteria bacterium]
MPERSLWTGTISFGLVTIPVRLVSAVRHKEVQFHEVHARDGARIFEKRFCTKDGREVSWDQIARGFAISARRVVLVTPRELDAANPAASRRIAIESFVRAADVDPILIQRTYYLVPEAAGRTAYSLLVRAMEQTSRAAIGRIVIRQHQYVCMLRPYQGAVALSTLLYADEVVPPKRAGAASTAAKPGELRVASEVVRAMSKPFQPGKYKDEHRRKVLALVKKKARGAKIEVPRVTPAKTTRVAELLKTLEQSKEVAAFARSRRR